MESLRDQAVIDRLQNRIMNLIHDALSDQNGSCDHTDLILSSFSGQ